jgi:hypothetical protein
MANGFLSFPDLNCVKKMGDPILKRMSALIINKNGAASNRRKIEPKISNILFCREK